MKKMTTRQMAADSMLAAMCAVLGAVALDAGNLKITLESVPIIVGALLFGSLDGAAIGFVGTLVYQLLRYGVSVTTLLWVLPYVVCGLIIGLYAQKRGFSLSTKQTIIIVVIAELVRLHRRALRDMRRQGDSHWRADAAAGADTA